jgi:hypothetical protein
LLSYRNEKTNEIMMIAKRDIVQFVP